MKYKIWWKRINPHFGRGGAMQPIIRGIKTYDSREAAEKQINIWRAIFPFNKYEIE